jgi:hypothetical protein
LLHRVASGQFLPPQRSGPLTPVIMRMLAIDTDVRPSMGAVAESLAQLPTRSRPAEQAAPVAASEAGPEEPDTPAALAPPSRDHQPPEPRRRRGLAAAVAVVALIGIGIVVTALLVNDRRAANPTVGDGQSSAAAPATTSLTPSPTPRVPSPTPQASAPRQGPAPKPTPRSKARTRSPAPSPTTAPTVRGTPTAAELRRAITSYYALVPRNTDAAWPRMTASYQTNPAGGREGYQRFWDAISKITVADVRGIPPDSAQATLTYYFNDGRVTRERTAYGLVNEGGRLKINSSTVLSSVTL